MRRSNCIKGRLRLELRDPGGRLLAERRASNMVLRSGAELVAALFSGKAATPVNGVAVGINPTPSSPPYEGTTLTTAAPDGTAVLAQAACALDPALMQAEVLANELKVRISIRSVMGANRAVSPDANVKAVNIGEAALGVLSGDGKSLVRIYNRVVFEPVPKGRDQELALYWEVDFPYGV
jgi:hypothetical protein